MAIASSSFVNLCSPFHARNDVRKLLHRFFNRALYKPYSCIFLTLKGLLKRMVRLFALGIICIKPVSTHHCNNLFCFFQRIALSKLFISTAVTAFDKNPIAAATTFCRIFTGAEFFPNCIFKGASDGCFIGWFINYILDIAQITEFIESVPYITELQREFYERYVSARYDLILRPAYEMAMVQPQDDGWTMSELQ